MTESNSVFLTYLDRQHDILLVTGDPWAIHRDLELHILACGLVLDPVNRDLLKNGLSAMSLYLISRPRFESFGWTINLQNPPRNIFLTGSARDCTVVGRIFLENVQPSPRPLFFAQISRPFGELQTSSVGVEGEDVFDMVEHFCARSDQQPVRYFNMPPGIHGAMAGKIALISTLPGADKHWFQDVTATAIPELENSDAVKLISERPVVFRCGCSLKPITQIVVRLYRQEPEDLFRGDAEVEVECPRCAARHVVTREEFDRQVHTA